MVHTVSGGLFPGVIPGFDPTLDRVTGALYLLRIRKEETREILTAEMTPDSKFMGKHFAVTVHSVGKARMEEEEEGDIADH